LQNWARQMMSDQAGPDLTRSTRGGDADD